MYQNHPHFLRVLVEDRQARLREQADQGRFRRQVRRARRQRRD